MSNSGFVEQTVKMVLADLGRKITSALRSLSNATIINEEVRTRGRYWYLINEVGVGIEQIQMICICDHG